MRIKLAVVLALIVGAVLIVYLLFGNQMLSPLQLAQAKTACQECHSRPAFTRASDVHARHPQLSCATCHPQNPPVVDFDACMFCHGKPQYTSARVMHDTHAALSCIHCHRYNAGLKTTDNLRNGLKWFGMGILLFGLIGLTANFIMVNRKTKME